MNGITQKKVKSLVEKDNLEITGQVLTREDGTRAIVELGAVRWLTNDEMWRLMHPDDIKFAVEFEGQTFALNPCPWCRSGSFSIRANRMWTGMKYSEPTSVELYHYCDPEPGQPSRPITRVGRDLQSAMDAWNKRK